jgi:hypothetical protein
MLALDMLDGENPFWESQFSCRKVNFLQFYTVEKPTKNEKTGDFQLAYCVPKFLRPAIPDLRELDLRLPWTANKN